MPIECNKEIIRFPSSWLSALGGWPASISMNRPFGPFSDKSFFMPFRMLVENPYPFTGISQIFLPSKNIFKRR
jgi:hypothetical protein